MPTIMKKDSTVMRQIVLVGCLGWCLYLSPAQAQMTFSDKEGDFARQKDKYLAQLKVKSPRLYEYTVQQFELQQKMAEIIADYAEKKIEHQVAVDRLKPLLVKQQEVSKNPEYLAEQMLAMSAIGGVRPMKNLQPNAASKTEKLEAAPGKTKEK